ncbi:hypothetical protein BHE74_00010685 [Ensete ventricosum]|nr:hypothetical protein GW17_00049275 [Ensete ventricosum]RWW80953.1 hypothetical protein BHE74_00010685 [Ensete ventricosum]RZR95974.1 hypothetical protein BHM03_00024921 [Ensete ventricosum]
MAAPSTGKEIYKDYPRSSRSMICPPSSSKAPVIIAGKKKMASVGIADAKLREDQSLCFGNCGFCGKAPHSTSRVRASSSAKSPSPADLHLVLW